MSPEPVTAERTYARLKAEIMTGRYSPRAPLNTQAIADDYGTSISPIRDSMQRLIGERMLEAQVGGGFQVPDVTTAGLRDLYSWHGQLVGLALRQLDPADVEAPAGLAETASHPVLIANATAAVFATIACHASNRELRAAILSAGERLHLARLCEAGLIGGIATEIESIRVRLLDGPDPDLRDAIKAYHRRRLRRVDQLHALLHNPERLHDL